MDLAIVTTTINVPEVLRDYRRECPDAHIIIIGDTQTPHDAVRSLAADIGNAEYLGPKEQETLYPALSDAIGWRCIQRRNIGIVRALVSGADAVMLLDDDNIPTAGYGPSLDYWFDGPVSMPVVVWNHRWFNVGMYGYCEYYARGYPYSLRSIDDRTGPAHHVITEPVTVGAFTSLIYGDPDINATERMELAPDVVRYALPAESNSVAINPRYTWGPVNSQATVVRREVAPLFGLPPGIGRYDDIVAGYVAQRVMGEYGYHVVYGVPKVRQDRNPHNLLNDLEAELWGMRHTEAVCEFLASVPLRGASIADDLATIVDELSQQDVFPWPVQSQRFYDEWVRTVGRIVA